MGSTRGDFGGILGRLWGGRGGSERVGGGHPEADFFHFLGCKIMELCENLSLLLKRLEIDKNHFFDGFFLNVDFIRFFSGATCTKIFDFFNIFYDKKIIFLRKNWEIWESRVRRRFRESRVRRRRREPIWKF